MSSGLVMRSTGSRYLVRGEDGSLHKCVAKGNLRIKGWKSTNPLAVGDRVEFIPQQNEEDVGSIMELHDRTNYIVRRSVNLSHHKHVIAANVDQAILLVTLARPRTSYGFIDRFLVTAEIYRVPCIVVFNKIDDYSEEELDMLAEYEDTYQNAGYRTLITSASSRRWRWCRTRSRSPAARCRPSWRSTPRRSSCSSCRTRPAKTCSST